MDEMPAKTSRLKCRKCGAPLAIATLRGYCVRCLLLPVADPLSSSTNDSSSSANSSESSQENAAPALGTFGEYELLQLIARGGMGLVYRAKDNRANRIVALKMILTGRFAGQDEIKRFRTEAEAIAHLDHPNIVPVYEVGEVEGQPFFTMKLVEGGSLAGVLKQSGLAGGDATDLRPAARLVSKVARAIHHAHQRGVLHRDLKPANILLGPKDEPFVTDFGLARRVDSESSLTGTGAIVGTPDFMSPEQAAGKSREVTTAADTYSLGAILYYLVTGRPPFQASSGMETIRLVMDEEPRPPSQINHHIDRDLETICLKCLEKSPANRYASAAMLADDLDRWAQGETIMARRATAVERAVKWVKRKPVIAALTGITIVAILAGVLGVFYQWRVAEARGDAEAKARQEAQRARGKTEEAYRGTAALLNRIELEKANDLLVAGNSPAGLAHLAQVLRRDPSNVVAASRLVNFIRRRTLAAGEVTEFKTTGKIFHTALSPDGALAISVSDSTTNNLRLWRMPEGTEVAAMTHPFDTTPEITLGQGKAGPPQFPKGKGMFMKQKGQVSGQPSLALSGLPITTQFSADGLRVVSQSNDQTVRIWDATTGQAVTPLLEHSGPLLAVEFSPDRQELVTICRDGSIRIWDAATGKLQSEFGLALRAVSARINPARAQLVAAYADGSARVWDLRDFKMVGSAVYHRTTVRVMALSPAGNMVCSATGEDVNLWTPGVQGMRTIPHAGIITDVSFSNDGKTLIICGDTGARIVNLASEESRAFAHPEPVLHAMFDADDRQLATVSRDGSVRVWDLASGTLVCEPLLHSSRAFSARFTGSRNLVVVCRDGLVVRWTITQPPPISISLNDSGAVPSAVFSSDGALVLTANRAGRAQLWDVKTGSPAGQPLIHGAPLVEVAFSPDGSRILTVGNDSTVKLWDARTAQLMGKPMRHASAVLQARFSPDGKRILALTQSGVGRIWDAQTGEGQGGGTDDRPTVRHTQLSPDGQFVVVATPFRAAALYNLNTGEQVGPPMQHSGIMSMSSFSPDGSRIITSSFDNTARIWDARTQQPLTAPLRHDGAVHFAIFSSDGRKAVTGSEDNFARIWATVDGATLVHSLEHAAAVNYAEFSQDGSRLLTVADDFSVHLWNVSSGQKLTGTLKHDSVVTQAHFSPDGQTVLIASEKGGVQLWSIPNLPTPAPPWLFELAETVGGLRIDSAGLIQPAPRPSLAQFKKKLPDDDVSRSYLKELAWLFPSTQK